MRAGLRAHAIPIALALAEMRVRRESLRHLAAPRAHAVALAELPHAARMPAELPPEPTSPRSEHTLGGVCSAPY